MAMGVPPIYGGLMMDNPMKTWMMTGGTLHDFGNHHILMKVVKPIRNQVHQENQQSPGVFLDVVHSSQAGG